MSKQSGRGRFADTPVNYEQTVREEDAASVQGYTGTPVHYEQTVREEDASSVQGYTGTLWANSQGGGCGECARIHR